MPSAPSPLPAPRRGPWGGRRPGAGRPPKGPRAGVPHLRRPALSSRFPVHVTWRVRPGFPNLRSKRAFRSIRRSLVAARERLGGRVVHFSVQSNHVHLIVEASSRGALSRALQGLGIRLARGLNLALGRSGSVLSDRYHARALQTPLQVRRALAYVLGNVKKHAAERGVFIGIGWMDGCSSAAWFDGWQTPNARERALGLGRSPPDREPLVAPARTWLLSRGWRRHGLLDPDHVPGPRYPVARRASVA